VRREPGCAIGGAFKEKHESLTYFGGRTFDEKTLDRDISVRIIFHYASLPWLGSAGLRPENGYKREIC
jgi:hypothetical protein